MSKQVNIRFEALDFKLIKSMAELRQMTVSDLIRTAVSHYVSKQHDAKEALRRVDDATGDQAL